MSAGWRLRTVRRTMRRVLLTLLVAAAALASAISASAGAPPKLVGNPAAGKAVFMTNCAACHTLKAAAAVGVNGTNLDKTPLPEATTIKVVLVGGTAMGAAAKKWPIQMQGYKTSLSAKQINDVSAFVYASTHKS